MKCDVIYSLRIFSVASAATDIFVIVVVRTDGFGLPKESSGRLYKRFDIDYREKKVLDKEEITTFYCISHIH